MHHIVARVTDKLNQILSAPWQYTATVFYMCIVLGIRPPTAVANQSRTTLLDKPWCQFRVGEPRQQHIIIIDLAPSVVCCAPSCVDIVRRVKGFFFFLKVLIYIIMYSGGRREAKQSCRTSWTKRTKYVSVVLITEFTRWNILYIKL